MTTMMPMLTQQSLQSFRADILAHFGANALEVEELLAYNQNVFAHQTLNSAVEFPLTPETHVAVWEEYTAIARAIGVFETLKQRFVQLQFPIQQGISETEAYRAATRRGVSTKGMVEASGLVLQQSDRIQLIIHQSLAGKIPVLLVENRADFVTLVQALCKRNEPIPIPASMGACLVSSLNNWDRIDRYRQQWRESRRQEAGGQKERISEIDWNKECEVPVGRAEGFSLHSLCLLFSLTIVGGLMKRPRAGVLLPKTHSLTAKYSLTFTCLPLKGCMSSLVIAFHRALQLQTEPVRRESIQISWC